MRRSTVTTRLLRDVKALYFAPAVPITGRPQLRLSSRSDQRSNEDSDRPRIGRLGAVGGVVASSCLGLAWYLKNRGDNEKDSFVGQRLLGPLPHLNAKGDDEKPATVKKVSLRERRYKDFSSIRFQGEPYMTPRDFLESVTLDEPRRMLF